MANEVRMGLSFRRVPNNPNMFEFTVTSSMLRAQFRLPRALVNQLRVSLEKALTKK